MTVELANGKEVTSRHAVGSLGFALGGKNTSAYFRTLPIGLYDGILGMDWLSANHASIHCAQGSLTFQDSLGQEILVQGKNGKPRACLVKTNRMLKGMKAGQQIFIVKLNKVEGPKEGSDPD